ncbi:MAG TPA: 16S rRNA (cytosine(1402)-N(4))-methyltransferase [Candidatus Portnoybacteria bacterium]|nr:16S rRNA (cytosine(1402)-N(4))-methyltransferase [Candidatus Portnoybacteria bacterium]
MEYRHVPVMLDEVISYLALKEGRNYIDATMGGAGYSLAIAEQIGEGKVLAIDLDEMAIKNAEKIIKQKKINNLVIANDNFANLEQIILEKFNGQKADFDGIVFDLGLSSAQLADRSRGFSFAYDTPLVMSFGSPDCNALHSNAGGSQGGEPKQTTEQIVNNWQAVDLVRIFRKYGEEKFAGRIANAIAASRIQKKIETTGELVKIIEKAVPISYVKKPGIHFATRVFQALRIVTNQELENLEQALVAALKVLAPGGRLVVVSYHSLEDRIVKNFFRREARGCECPSELPVCVCGRQPKVKILTKKPLQPSELEVDGNPRARSAKLRAAEVI